MTKEKKCPFNKFNVCIGSECVFFLDPVYSKGAIYDNDLVQDPADISFPCSITIMGKLAFLSSSPKSKEVK